MKVAIALLLVALVSATDFTYLPLFKAWINQYNKVYSHEEFAARFQTFVENSKLVMSHNAQNGVSYTLSMNEFGDLTNAEFVRMFTGLMPREAPYARSLNTVTLPPATNDVDWVTKGGVTPIKNQQQCGSCWAFSSTGAIEGAGFVHFGQLVSLSEQQLVDCSKAYGNEGCNGGLMDQAFQYVIANHGLCSEQAYPYYARDMTCTASKCKSEPTSAITAYTDVPANNEPQLAAALQNQPIAVAVEADQSGWQFYHSGVFDGACGTSLDHGVLAVGYGTDSATGKLYWRVKNSWGTSWGNMGYIYLIRHNTSGSPGQCGIAMMASYPHF